jgi:flagellar L-ring protein precursor FlgH
VAAPVVNNGSIFQAGQYRPLFEDHRARMVGDTLNVQIVEKVAASQKSTSSIDNGGAISGGVSALPGIRAGAFARAAVEGSSTNTFAGKGSTENTNDFSGVITSVVTEVLPNGHLMITGEKQIGVNQNVDVLRFSARSTRGPSSRATPWLLHRSPTCASTTGAAARRPMPTE